MTRKRFVKKLMGMGVSRNEAVAEAEWVTSSKPIYGKRRSWSYEERFKAIGPRVAMNMGIRWLSKAFANAGMSMHRAADAFSPLVAAMASPLHEVAERFDRREGTDDPKEVH